MEHLMIPSRGSRSRGSQVKGYTKGESNATDRKQFKLINIGLVVSVTSLVGPRNGPAGRPQLEIAEDVTDKSTWRLQRLFSVHMPCLALFISLEPPANSCRAREKKSLLKACAGPRMKRQGWTVEIVCCVGKGLRGARKRSWLGVGLKGAGARVHGQRG
ncbi:uncharacterized protein MCYG_07614 [Microsporum canis CBS 113480]|uniref:Uncharacterized protein n=1 Tax=Arthroderma otae (strain ATCC MYA-4605 / CBS 113480) TaxID=554155 RepID=C5FWV5_ARTOC|nr:uncharacterized protein MCYG_07614 [Microsporum canis CBS 113480]EEQ34795.1 predicted protein [Microsporum canis CBS 113480]